MYIKVFLLVLFVTSRSTGSSNAADSATQGAASQYLFSYGVNDEETGSNFAHQESKDGIATTGQYRVALPDGRTQVVTYTADENGYNAVVTYEGVAVHPDEDQSDIAVAHPPTHTRIRRIRPVPPTVSPSLLPPLSIASDLGGHSNPRKHLPQVLSQNQELPVLPDQDISIPLFANQGHGFPLLSDQGPSLHHFTDKGSGLQSISDQGAGLPLFPNQAPDFPLLHQAPDFPLLHQAPDFPLFPSQASDFPLLPNQALDFPLFTNQAPDFPLFPHSNDFSHGIPNIHPDFNFNIPTMQPGPLLHRSKPVTPKPSLVPTHSSPNLQFPFHSAVPPNNFLLITELSQFPLFQNQLDPKFQQVSANSGHPGGLHFPISPLNNPNQPLSLIPNIIHSGNNDPSSIFIDIPKINPKLPNAHTLQPNLSLFIPENDLHNPNLPAFVKNAVRFHPLPIRSHSNVAANHPFTFLPPITPFTSPPLQHSTTVRHHGTPAPQHSFLASHAPVTVLPNLISHEPIPISHHTTLPPSHVTFSANHVKGRPNHGTSFVSTPVQSIPAHHIRKVPPIGTPVPHENIFSSISGTPHPPSSSLHDTAVPHHAILSPPFGTISFPHNTPFSTSATPFHQNFPLPPDGTPSPILSTPGHIPISTPKLGIPPPLHGPTVIKHNTHAPNHGNSVHLQGPPIFLHGTPTPVHGSSISAPHRNSVIPEHRIPISHIGTPIPRHETPATQIVSPLPPQRIHEPPPGIHVPGSTRPIHLHHDTPLAHFDLINPNDIIPTTFRPLLPPSLSSAIPIAIPKHSTLISHPTSPTVFSDSHEGFLHPSVFHPSTLQPKLPVIHTSPLNRPNFTPLHSISTPFPRLPPLGNKLTSRLGKSLGKSPPQFLPGSPGLDREQVLQKKLKRPSRITRSLLKNNKTR